MPSLLLLQLGVFQSQGLSAYKSELHRKESDV